MAVAVDAASQGSATSATSLTFQHTAAGSDRLAVVSAENYRAGFTPVNPTATYDSTSMTSKANTAFGSGSAEERLTMFYLTAPATTTDADVVIDVGATAYDEIVGGITTFTGVDQTTPLDTASTEVDNSVTASTMDITSATGDMVVDAISFYNSGGDTVTVGASQTEQVAYESTSIDCLYMSTEAGSTTTTMSWSFGASFYTGQIGVNINALGSVPKTGTDSFDLGESAALTTDDEKEGTDSGTLGEASSHAVDGVSTDSGTLGEAASGTADATATDTFTFGESGDQETIIPKTATDTFTFGEVDATKAETQYGFPDTKIEAAFGWEWNAVPHGFIEFTYDSSGTVIYNASGGSAFMPSGDVLTVQAKVRAEDIEEANYHYLIYNLGGTYGGYAMFIHDGYLGLRIGTGSAYVYVEDDTKLLTRITSQFAPAGDFCVRIDHDFSTGVTTFYRSYGSQDGSLTGWTKTGGPTSLGDPGTITTFIGGSGYSGTNGWQGRVYSVEAKDGSTSLFELDFDDWVEDEDPEGYQATLTAGSSSYGDWNCYLNDGTLTRAWTEITDWVKGKVLVQRGRQHELGRFEAGKITYTLTSNDDRWNPENASSPYYPMVRPMTPTRVSAEDPVNSEWYELGRAYIKKWPQKWTHAGKVSHVPIVAVDALGIFARTNLSDWVTQVLDDAPIAFYRGNTFSGDWPDESEHDNNHDLTGSGTAVTGSSTRPIIGPSADYYSDFSGDWWLDGVANPADLRIDGDLTIEFWIWPKDNAITSTIARCDVGGTNILYQVAIASKTSIIVGHTNSDGVYEHTTLGEVELERWQHVVIVRDATAGTWAAYVDGVEAIFSPRLSGTPATSLGTEDLSVGGTTAADSHMRISEWAIYDKALTPGRINAHIQSRIMFRGFSSNSWTREFFFDTAEIIGWPADLFYSTLLLGAGGKDTGADITLDSTVLKLWRLVAESGDYAVFQERGGRITLYDRYYRPKYYDTPVETFGDNLALGEYGYRTLEVPNDESLVRNIWEVVPVDGLEERASDGDSIAIYGPRTERITDFVISDNFGTEASQAKAYDRARYGLARAKDAEPRIEKFSITGQSNADMWETIMPIEISQRIKINRTPPGGTMVGREVYVEAVRHEFTIGNQWLTTLRLSPAEKFDVWILGDSVMGVLGGTTVLGWGD